MRTTGAHRRTSTMFATEPGRQLISSSAIFRDGILRAGFLGARLPSARAGKPPCGNEYTPWRQRRRWVWLHQPDRRSCMAERSGVEEPLKVPLKV